MGNIIKKGGILHFDVSSEYKLKNVISNNTFCEDDDDYSYIWFNTPYDDRVVMEMSVFLREKDIYIKRESVLTEYIHTRQSLESALINSGFTLVRLFSFNKLAYSGLIFINSLIDLRELLTAIFSRIFPISYKIITINPS